MDNVMTTVEKNNDSNNRTDGLPELMCKLSELWKAQTINDMDSFCEVLDDIIELTYELYPTINDWQKKQLLSIIRTATGAIGLDNIKRLKNRKILMKILLSNI